MADNEYGVFAQRMRKSRGYTQDELAQVSGVSISTVRNLEWSGDSINIRGSSLDAILIALAQKAPIGASEIHVLAQATGRKFESIERLNDRADELRNAAMHAPTPRKPTEPTIEERLMRVIHRLIAAGHGEDVLVQLEALAARYDEQIAKQERTAAPKHTPRAPERPVGHDDADN